MICLNRRDKPEPKSLRRLKSLCIRKGIKNMDLAHVAVMVCVALAINVGANNSAAEMGPAFGAGVRSQKEAPVWRLWVATGGRKVVLLVFRV